jgi:hypothetical protein
LATYTIVGHQFCGLSESITAVIDEQLVFQLDPYAVEAVNTVARTVRDLQ